MAEIVLITGLSGAGRSGAAGVFEDLGYYVVDNLPTPLVPTIAELAGQPGSEIQRLALVAGRNHDNLVEMVSRLRHDGHEVRVLYLDARKPVLVRRYDATRRTHPFATDDRGLTEAIDLERDLLGEMKQLADLVIDTSDLNVHQLKARIVGAFGEVGEQRLTVSVESFGYKYGIPLDADIVMDVRFLPNPHWIEELRPLTGRDEAVSEFVLERPDTQSFLDHLDDLLQGILPSYEAEGRAYLTVAIGCTGGRHRSVAIAEALSSRLHANGVIVSTNHRDVDR